MNLYDNTSTINAMKDKPMTEHTNPPENNTVDTTELIPIDTSKVKIPDNVIEQAILGFAMGHSRQQVADELLKHLPDELKILETMEHKEAKALLCSRLRSADPTSTKFADKHKKAYRKALKSVESAVQGQIRTYIAHRIHKMMENDVTFDTLAERITKMLENIEQTKPTDNKEATSTIKALISLQKAQIEHTQTLMELIKTFKEEQHRYENTFREQRF